MVESSREGKRRPSGTALGVSAEHFAGFNRLECGAEIVASVLNQLDVALYGLAVEPFALRDLLRPFGERSSQVAAGQFKAQAATQERACVVAVLEKRFGSLRRGREDDCDVRRDAFQQHE